MKSANSKFQSFDNGKSVMNNQLNDNECVETNKLMTDKTSMILKLQEQLKIEKQIKRAAEQMLVLSDNSKGHTINKEDVEKQIKDTEDRIQNIAQQIHFLKGCPEKNEGTVKVSLAGIPPHSRQRRNRPFPTSTPTKSRLDQFNKDYMKESLEYAVLAVQNINVDQDLALDALTFLYKLVETVDNLGSIFSIEDMIEPSIYCVAGYTREIRAAGYRLLRQIALHYNLLEVITMHHLDVFLIRSMLKDHRYDQEREEAFKFIRLYVDTFSASNLIPQSIVRTLVAIAENMDEKYQKLCIETLCELSLLNVEIVAISGGIRCLFRVVLEGPPDMTDMVIMTILYIIDHESTRRYLRPSVDLEVIVASLTEFLLKQNSVSEDVMDNCVRVVAALLKSWSGFLYLSIDNSRAIGAILDALFIPVEINQCRILELFYQILVMDNVTVTFDEITLDKRKIDKISSGETSKKFTDTPVPNTAISLLNQYAALLLRVFVEAGLIQALDKLIQETANTRVMNRATALLSWVQQLTQRLLPPSLSFKINSLSSLFVSAADFENENKRRIATGTIVQIDKIIYAGQNYPDAQLSSCNLSTESIRIANLRSKLFNIVDDTTFKQLVNDAEVMCSKEFSKWNWDIIIILLHGSLRSPQKLDDVLRNFKFVRRILAFYKPSSSQLMDISTTPNTRKYIDLGCDLLELLLSNREGIRLLEESRIFNEIAEGLRLNELESDQSLSLFSRERMQNTLSVGYLEFINTLLEYEEGQRVLEKCQIINALYRIINSDIRNDIIYLLLQRLDYERVGHEQVFLQQALNSREESIRRFALLLIKDLLVKSTNREFKIYLIDQLIYKLVDPAYEIVQLSLRILEAIAHFPDLLEYIAQHICYLHHLELGTETLVLRCLSHPKGVAYLEGSKLVDEFFELWAKERMFQYVQKIDIMLLQQIMLTGPGNSIAFDYLKFRSRSVTCDLPVPHPVLNNDQEHPLIPTHFFGELAQTKRGSEKILKSAHFKRWCKMMRSYAKRKSHSYAETEEFKAILWTMGHIARSQHIFDELVQEDVISSIFKTALDTSTLSLKGTCFYIIGMISTNPIAIEILNSYGWEIQVSSIRGICLPKLLRSFLDIFQGPFIGSWPSLNTELCFRQGDFGDKEYEILELMGNISNHILSNSSSRKLNKIKVEMPHLFTRVDLYIEMLRLTSYYHYRLSIRRYLIDLFDVAFDETDVAIIMGLQGLFPQIDSLDIGEDYVIEEQIGGENPESSSSSLESCRPLNNNIYSLSSYGRTVGKKSSSREISRYLTFQSKKKSDTLKLSVKSSMELMSPSTSKNEDKAKNQTSSGQHEQNLLHMVNAPKIIRGFVVPKS